MRTGTITHAKPLFQDNYRDNTSTFGPDGFCDIKFPAEIFHLKKRSGITTTVEKWVGT